MEKIRMFIERIFSFLGMRRRETQNERRIAELRAANADLKLKNNNLTIDVSTLKSENIDLREKVRTLEMERSMNEFEVREARWKARFELRMEQREKTMQEVHASLDRLMELFSGEEFARWAAAVEASKASQLAEGTQKTDA